MKIWTKLTDFEDFLVEWLVSHQLEWKLSGMKSTDGR